MGSPGGSPQADHCGESGGSFLRRMRGEEIHGAPGLLAQWRGALSYCGDGEELGCPLSFSSCCLPLGGGWRRTTCSGAGVPRVAEKPRGSTLPHQEPSSPRNILLLGQVPILFPRPFLPLASRKHKSDVRSEGPYLGWPHPHAGKILTWGLEEGTRWPGIHATVLQHWRAARPGGMDEADKQALVSCGSVTGEAKTG